MAKVRMSRSWGKLGLVLLMLCFVVIRPRTASDPVLPVQSGQSPSAQGTMVSGSVSGFSGTYSTSIPVEVLPGRNGLQPAVAISYASTNADGIAGVGWGIPSSSITRTGPKRGAPTYSDSDEFYMSLNGSGVQLMPMGSKQADNTQVFHTRVESWSKAIAHYYSYSSGGVTIYSAQVEYWEVWSKSGECYYFGPLASETPAQDGSYSLLVTNSNALDPYRNQWMLRKVVDVDGNTMEYVYGQGTQDSQGNWSSAKSFLPSLIKYGANDSLGYSHFAGVKFEYEARPDKRFSYRNGVEQDSGDRLASVKVGTLNIGLTDIGQVLREYDLSYATSNWTGRSLLASVVVQGGGLSLHPITFSYATYDGNQPLVWSRESTLAPPPGMPFVGNYTKTDNQGSEEYAGTFSASSVLVDLNGDGLPDKVDAYASNIDNSTTGIYLNPGPTASQWTTVANPSIPGQPISYYYVDGAYQNGILV